jgi:hypothetical protein
MTIFQIGAVLFALFMMYVVSIHLKKKTLSFTEGSFWLSTWLVFIIIAVFPHLLIGISSALRFARVFDLLVVMALMVLTVVIFMSYFAQKEATHKLEKFVRQKAINEVKKK